MDAGHSALSAGSTASSGLGTSLPKCGGCGGWGVGLVMNSGFCKHCAGRQPQPQLTRAPQQKFRVQLRHSAAEAAAALPRTPAEQDPVRQSRSGQERIKTTCSPASGSVYYLSDTGRLYISQKTAAADSIASSAVPALPPDAILVDGPFGGSKINAMVPSRDGLVIALLNEDGHVWLQKADAATVDARSAQQLQFRRVKSFNRTAGLSQHDIKIAFGTHHFFAWRGMQGGPADVCVHGLLTEQCTDQCLSLDVEAAVLDSLLLVAPNTPSPPAPAAAVPSNLAVQSPPAPARSNRVLASTQGMLELPFFCSKANVLPMPVLEALLHHCVTNAVPQADVSALADSLLARATSKRHLSATAISAATALLTHLPPTRRIALQTMLARAPAAQSEYAIELLNKVDQVNLDALPRLCRSPIAGVGKQIRTIRRLHKLAQCIDSTNTVIGDAQRVSSGIKNALRAAIDAEAEWRTRSRAEFGPPAETASAVSSQLQPLQQARARLLSDAAAAFAALEAKLSMMTDTASTSNTAGSSARPLMAVALTKLREELEAYGGPGSSASVPVTDDNTPSASASTLIIQMLAAFAAELSDLSTPLDVPLRRLLSAIARVEGPEFMATEDRVRGMAAATIAAAAALIELQSKELRGPLDQQRAHLLAVQARVSDETETAAEAAGLERLITELREKHGAARKKARKAKFELDEARDDGDIVTREMVARVESLQNESMSITRQLEAALASLQALVSTGIPEALVYSALARRAVTVASLDSAHSGAASSQSALDAHWQSLVDAGIGIEGRSRNDYSNIVPLQHTNSAVFTARLRAVGEDQARKVLKEYVIGRDDLIFINEITVLRSLNHPNIIALEAAVRDETAGRIYLQFPQAEGGNLRQWLAAAPRSVEDRLSVFQGIIHGLSYLHSKHIVHRDLKPENILITADGVPRLADFGLAYQERSALMSMIPTIAAATAGAGTDLYKSPEQLRHERVSTSSDLYACGLVLWELLTGFQYPIPVAARSAASNGAPVPADDFARAAQDVPPSTAEAAQSLLRRLLAPDAADRGTAHAMLVHHIFSVRAAAAGNATAARTPTSQPSPRSPSPQGGVQSEHQNQFATLCTTASAVRRRVPAGSKLFGSIAEALLAFGMREPGPNVSGVTRLVLELDMSSARSSAAATGSPASSEVAVDTAQCLDTFLTHCLSADRGIFEVADEGARCVLPVADCTDETKKLHLRAFGVGLAQVLLNSTPLDIAQRLPLIFYRCLLRGPSAVARETSLEQLLKDLAEFDGNLAQQYRFTLSTPGVESLMLPGGRSERGLPQDITDTNKDVVLRRACIERLISNRLDSLDAIRSGFLSAAQPLTDLLLSIPSAEALRELLFNSFVRQRREQLRAEDEASSRMVISSTKPCPRCGVRIEKNGGCNHMYCISCQLHYNWE